MPGKKFGTWGNDKLYGTAEDDAIDALGGNDLIWGEGGDDLIYGGDGNDLLVGGDGHDLLLGGAGNDWLVGNAGDDVLRGGAGADAIDGASGRDTASYQFSPSGVNVSLLLDSAAGGDAQGDDLENIESLIGTSFGDYLAGDDQDNLLEGGGGDDMLLGFGGTNMLSGDSGNDTLYGGSGIDDLHGGTGNDKLFGGDGYDRLVGGAGADQLDGGLGLIDTAFYSASAAGVTIDLSVNLASGGDAQGDVLTGIERLVGSEQDDALAGQGDDNVIVGGGGGDVLRGYDGNDFLIGDYDLHSFGGSAGGNDTLFGGHGDDRLIGAEGDDTLYGGAGDDDLNGGPGSDQLHGGTGVDQVMYWASDAGITIDLALGVAKGGHAAGDVLTGIENMTGSSHDDLLIGNDTANKLEGSGGTDTLVGNSGADTFGFLVVPAIFGPDVDQILDFSQKDGDRIELRQSSLPSAPAPLDIVFIGGQKFSGQAGELQYEQDGKNTWVSLDFDGNADADLQIMCAGTINFTVNDFIFAP